VVIATGNDWRAIEAGAHAYAARSGRYASLTAWERNGDGDLVGSIELPMAVGLGDGAEIRTPMAISVIAGLLSSTVLTLIIVPTIYSVLDSATARLRRHTTDEREIGEMRPAPREA